MCELQRPQLCAGNACPKKKAAHGDTKEWKSSSPKWRQRGEASLPGELPSGIQETPRDRQEVEEECEPASGETMEE